MKAFYALAAACAISLLAPGPAFAAVATTDLGIAAAAGDTTKLKSLLAAGQNINTRDSEGYSPLMWAALNGQINAVSTLITLGANLNVQDREGYTALMWASQNKHVTVVRQLLNAGASVNTRDNHGYTALHWAAQDGQLAITQMLLQRDADTNARDSEGYTPLMWAAQQGHRAVVYELLSHGANTSFRDRRGYTAYDLTNAYVHPDVRKMIRNYRPYTAIATQVAYRPAGGYVIPAPPRQARAFVDYQPVAVVNPRHNHYPIVAPKAVPVSSGIKPKLVAVVNTPDSPYWAGPSTYTPASIKAAWWGTQQEAQLTKYDVDKNRQIDGRDWKNLANTTSRIALAQLLYQSRVGKAAACPTNQLNAIMNKLDWVYNQANRIDLTLNQAWDLPSAHFERIRW